MLKKSTCYDKGRASHTTIQGITFAQEMVWSI